MTCIEIIAAYFDGILNRREAIYHVHLAPDGPDTKAHALRLIDG